MNPCNNKARCHTLQTISDDPEAMRVICVTCKEQYVIRKDHRAVPENRAYSKIFKKDVLQGNDNLFYKYHPEYLKI